MTDVTQSRWRLQNAADTGIKWAGVFLPAHQPLLRPQAGSEKKLPALYLCLRKGT